MARHMAEGTPEQAPDDETRLMSEDELRDAADVEPEGESEETTLLPADDEEETRLLADADRFETIGRTELMPTPIEEDTDDPRVQTMRMVPAGRDTLFDEEAQAQKKKSHRRLAVVYLLMAVLIAAAAAFVSYGAELWGGKTVPGVIGRSQQAATSLLEARGFTVSVVEEPADEKIGKVTAQSPAGGERLEAGETIEITVAVARVVPNVTGMAAADAEAALHDAGAETIKTTYTASDQPAGTVLGTDPEAGQPFKSHDAITLVVAQAFSVPDLVGQKEADAIKALESVGMTANVTYTDSDQEDHTVLSMDPAPGTEVAAGAEVALSVAAPYPDDVHLVADYAAHQPADISKWLADQGFRCTGGAVDSAGYAAATYSDGGATVTLTSTPFVNSVDLSEGNQGDVLADGKWFEGVRYEFGANEQPSGASALSDGAVRSAMATCGLNGWTDTCTQDSVVLPAPATAEGHRFICAYGEMGDNCWTVLVEATDSGSRTVVTYAPKSVYDSANLSGTGGRICDYVAYMYLYS